MTPSGTSAPTTKRKAPAKRGQASSATTRVRKPTGKKTGGASSSSGAKSGRRAPGKKAGKKGTSLFLPLCVIAVWVFAVGILAGSIYYGWNDGNSRSRSTRPKVMQESATRTAAAPKPASKPRGPVAPAPRPADFPAPTPPATVTPYGGQSPGQQAARTDKPPGPPATVAPTPASVRAQIPKSTLHPNGTSSGEHSSGGTDESPSLPAPISARTPEPPGTSAGAEKDSLQLPASAQNRNGSSRTQPADSSAKEGLLALNTPAPQPDVPIPAQPDLGPTTARVAIVIDDFGMDLEIARKFAQIPIPITFSVLPYQRYSQEVSQLAQSHGREVILHIPMEPHGYPKVHPGSGALLLSMSSDEIRNTLDGVLDSNPYASGINNHMGSRFTEQEEAMGTVLSGLKKRGLYFLDSYTTPQSTGMNLARRMHVPTGRRDVFLDHVASEKFVRSQIRQLIEKAHIQGSAVAIGHPHGYTLRVLRQEAATFRKEGVAVVPLKNLMTTSAE